MTTRLKKSITAAAIIISTIGSAKIVEVDEAKSGIEFKIKHMIFATANGKFKSFSGKFEKDETNFLNSKMNFKVQVSSIDTDSEKRDNHLKTSDFFDVEKYPEAEFKSTTIKSNGNNSYILSGELTIHGVSKNVNFDLNEEVAADGKSLYVAETKLNRLDFKVGKSSMMVGDEVNLVVKVQSL